MRPIGFRPGIRAMMILIAISAVFSAAWVWVPPALDPLLSDRSGTLPMLWIGRGSLRHAAVRGVVAALVAVPFAIAVVLTFGSPPQGRPRRRSAWRWLGVIGSSACCLTILQFPLDGLRVAWLLRDGTVVCFYHQYRIWPGAHVTPCLELTTPAGRARSYPIARNFRYQWDPELRTDADQTLIWLVDGPAPGVRYGGVWCAIDRRSGNFVGAGGPFPAGVGEFLGDPPTR